MGKPHKSFSKLAKFTSVDWEDVNERFQLDESDDDPPAGYGIAVSDAFGDDPEEAFVHEGDVHSDGDIAVGASGDYAGVYIIDGDLEVGGVLDFTQVDGAAILFVTGSLRAKTVAVAQEAQLWVGKNLEVSDYILAGVSDAGGLAVKGSANAKALIVTDSEMVAFGEKPKSTMKVIARNEDILDEDLFPKVLTTEKALVEPFGEDPDHEELVKAAKKGKAILR